MTLDANLTQSPVVACTNLFWLWRVKCIKEEEEKKDEKQRN